MRPFAKETFQGQSPLGPQYLIRHLRGDALDWEAVQKELQERRATMSRRHKNEVRVARIRECRQCGYTMEFTKTQNILGPAGKCKSCTEREKTKTCQKCHQTLPRDNNFNTKQWNHFAKPTCLACTSGTSVAQETKTCQKCQQTLPRDNNFNAKQWKDFAKPTCLAGTRGIVVAQETKTCQKCQKTLPRDINFSARQWNLFAQPTCLACTSHFEGRLQEMLFVRAFQTSNRVLTVGGEVS